MHEDCKSTSRFYPGLVSIQAILEYLGNNHADYLAWPDWLARKPLGPPQILRANLYTVFPIDPLTH
jgi:hypothetical protein